MAIEDTFANRIKLPQLVWIAQWTVDYVDELLSSTREINENERSDVSLAFSLSERYHLRKIHATRA